MAARRRGDVELGWPRRQRRGRGRVRRGARRGARGCCCCGGGARVRRLAALQAPPRARVLRAWAHSEPRRAGVPRVARRRAIAQALARGGVLVGAPVPR